MAHWTEDEIRKINDDEWFHLSAALPDGTLPKTVDIWSVCANNRVFVRSYNGKEGKWFGPALESGKGHISAGGIEKDVTFVPVTDEALNKEVDEAYRTKYAGSPYAEPMATEPVRNNTLEVIPSE